MSLTKHARVRMQQRAISPLLVDLLQDFGSRQRAGGGSSLVFFDKRARRELRTYAGSMFSQINESLDVYAVLGSDGQVITTGYRTERIQRERDSAGMAGARRQRCRRQD